MANPQIDQFIDALFFKAGAVIVLCAIGGMVLREGLQWLERRVTQFGQQRRRRRDADRTAGARRSSAFVTYSAKNKTAAAVTTEPHCPVCNALMVKRTAKRGARAGSAFWGCTNYPDCRGTRQI
jgi:restriction system protein